MTRLAWYLNLESTRSIRTRCNLPVELGCVVANAEIAHDRASSSLVGAANRRSATRLIKIFAGGTLTINSQIMDYVADQQSPDGVRSLNFSVSGLQLIAP